MYPQYLFVLLETSVFDITCKNMPVLRYCMQIFYCYNKKTLIIDMCDCLLCVEIADAKAGRKIKC